MTVGELKQALGTEDEKDVTLYLNISLAKGDKVVKKTYLSDITAVKTHFLEEEVLIIGEEKHA